MRSGPTTGSRSSRTPGRCCTRSIICSGSQSREAAREFPRLRRRANLPEPDQGQDPGRFLDRLGRPRRRDHRLRQPDPGLSDRARDDGRGRPRPLRRADRRCRARRRQYLRSADRRRTSTTSATAGGSSTTTARASTRPAPTACSSGSTRFSARCGWRVVELRYGKRLRAALDANPKLKDWLETLPQCRAVALCTIKAARRWRKRIEADLGKSAVGLPQGA